MVRSGHKALQSVLLVLAYVVAALVTYGNDHAGTPPLVSLMGGVSIAALTLLGWQVIWVVVGAVLMHHLVVGHPITFAAADTIGCTAEALVGYLILRTLQVRAGCSRLRDVSAVYATAMIAPIARLAVTTIVFASLPAGSTDLFPNLGSWWRMSVIGILMVMPLALSWAQITQERDRINTLANASLWTFFAAASVGGVLLLDRTATQSIIMLGTLPLVAFVSALHIGNRGASTCGFVGALTIVLPINYGMHPFEGIDPSERYTVVQMVVGGIAALSPLFGALLAERDANAERWLQSEGLSQALLNILPDATYRLHRDGTILDAQLPDDPAIHGGANLIGKRIPEVVPPELAKRLLQQLDRAQRGLETESLEYRMVTDVGRRDREVRFVQLPNGETLSVARDITVRKRAERQLTLQATILEMIATGCRRSEVLEALLESLEQQIPDGRGMIMLRQADRLHVVAAPSLPDEYNRLVDGIEVKEGNGCCGTAAFRNETVVCSNTHTDPLTADWVDVAKRFSTRACWSVPIRASDYDVLGTLAIYHRTEREPQSFEIGLVERAAVLVGLQLERERREGLLRSIHQNATEGLFRCIPGERFIYVNKSFAELFGYESADEFLRESSNADHDGHRQSLATLVHETSSMRGQEMRLHCRNGDERWALVSTALSFVDDDQELICDGTIIDITERKRLEAQLRQAQKMEAVGQLAGGVAHDFNNLLTAIAGFAESVGNEVNAGSKVHKDVEQIMKAATRAAGLTRQLLAFGRKQVLSPRVLELHTVVEQIADMVRRLIGEHIELTIEPPRSSVRAKVDRGQFEQVILNLVINARDAMPDGGRITISTGSIDLETERQTGAETLLPGRYAVLQVRDTGTGMDKHVQARAFDPFFTTKDQSHGTGLGLSTVYGIVKQSDGEITIDSEPGVGACFTVYLPFASELPRPEPAVPLPRPSQQSGTVLVVEDEALVLELAERSLLAAGNEVLRASNGEQALALFRQHRDRIDIVVSDVVMPNMSGPELARQLRQEAPEVAILFISGYAQNLAEQPVATDERTDYLSKPFTVSQLNQRVGAMLAQRSDPQGQTENA